VELLLIVGLHSEEGLRGSSSGWLGYPIHTLLVLQLCIIYRTLQRLLTLILLFNFYCIEHLSFVRCSPMSLFTYHNRPNHSPVNR